MVSRVAFAAVLVLSVVLLFSPGSSVPTAVPISDKLVHFLLFAALAGTGRWAGVPLRVLAPALIAYAGGSELLQALLPLERGGDWRDALADSFGVLAGLGVVALVTRSNRRVGP